MREILNIDPRKATTENSIPSKTLKLSADISADVLHLFNVIYEQVTFQIIRNFST